MAIVNMGAILDQIGEFEDRLEKYYARRRDATHDNGVKLLAYYLSRHRRHLPRWLEQLNPRQLERLRKIELRLDGAFRPEKHFPMTPPPAAEIRGQQLLEAAMGYDQELIALYEKISDQLLNAEAHALFQSLINLEERDLVMLKKMIAMAYF